MEKPQCLSYRPFKDMNKIVTLLLLNCTAIIGFAQSPKRIVKKLGNDPVYYIDSINVDKSEMQRYNPNEIAVVTVFKGKGAVDLLGEDGKDGVVYIETKLFAKKRFWSFFRLKSAAYSDLVPTIGSDSTIQYILNKRVLKDDYEGTLASIDDKVFEDIKIVPKEILIKDYGILDKEYGVLIISKAPDNLYKGNKKF